MKRRSAKHVAGACAASLTMLLSGCAPLNHGALYGPPPDTTDGKVSMSSSAAFSSSSSEADEFDPSENTPEDIYGPPEDLEPFDEPDAFDPSAISPAVLYGPPEMFASSTADEDSPDDAESTTDPNSQ